MNKLVLLLLIIICYGCSQSNETEKYQKSRDHVINVRDKVKEIDIEDVLISGNARMRLLGDYLLVTDYKSFDKQIHLFDKNSFNYITSIAYKGEGPGEITNIGFIGTNVPERLFYVTDHGKQKIFSYDLDSVLQDPSYMPQVKMEMKGTQFPSEYEYINDTLCIGRIIEPIGNNDFRPSVGKWNMKTGEIQLMEYAHPEIEKPRFTFAVSMENGVYVQCYNYHDLLTICDLNGKLKYNIYGPNWDNKKSNRIAYYSNAIFTNNRIIISYSENNRLAPTQFHVFDLQGNYLKTLQIGYQIVDFCYDKDKNRLLINLNDEIQFAYLDLDNIL